MTDVENNMSRKTEDQELGPKEILYILKDIMRNVSKYYRFIPVCFVFVFLVFGFFYIRSPKSYAAQVVIGPPNPSPVYSMLSDMGSTDSGVGGLAKKFLSSGSSPSPFQKFQLLLNSKRLYEEMAAKDHLLQTVFAPQWDDQNKRWRHGPLHAVSTTIKQLIGWPVSDGPGADALQMSIQHHMAISDADFGSNGSMASLMAAGSGYFEIDLTARTPEEAITILSTILNRSDNIIRSEMKKDVDARIAFLSREIPNVTNSNQRESMIGILSDQEKIRTFLLADKHFSYVLVSGPSVGKAPVKPMRPRRAILAGIIISLLLWFILSALTLKVPYLQRKLRFFRKR